jgi:hypothetical protein
VKYLDYPVRTKGFNGTFPSVLLLFFNPFCTRPRVTVLRNRDYILHTHTHTYIIVTCRTFRIFLKWPAPKESAPSTFFRMLIKGIYMKSSWCHPDTMKQFLVTQFLGWGPLGSSPQVCFFSRQWCEIWQTPSTLPANIFGEKILQVWLFGVVNFRFYFRVSMRAKVPLFTNVYWRNVRDTN